MEKSLPPVASAAKIARPSVIVVAHTTDSRPAIDGDHVSGGAVAERAEHYQQRDHRQRADDGERHHGGIGGIAVHAMPGTSASATSTTYATI